MKTSTSTTLISLLVLLAGFGGVCARADTLVNWIGPTGMGGNGNWSTSADWSGGVVPNNGNGNAYSVTLPNYPSGPYNVTLDMGPTIDNLTLESNAALSTNPNQTLTTGSLTNAGEVGVSSGSILNVNGDVTNPGMLFINDGTNNQRSFASVSGDMSNSGPDSSGIRMSAGTLSVGGTLSLGGVNNVVLFLDRSSWLTATHYVQTGGQTQGIVFSSTMNVVDATVSGGEFALHLSTLNGNLTVEGAHFQNLIGTSFLNGSFTTDSSSTYAGDIFTGGFGWGRLAVSGDASLGGTMILDFSSIEKFHDGETFDILTYRAETGEFSTIEWTGLYPNQTVSLVYGPTELDVVVHGNALPEPTSLLLMSTGLLGLAYHRQRNLAGTTMSSCNVAIRKADPSSRGLI